MRAGAAQSLGDIAKREEARRQQATSDRVYTNDDLAPVVPVPAPAAPDAPAVASDAAPPATDADVPDATKPGPPTDPAVLLARMRAKRGEAYWRKRATDIRSGLARAEVDLAQTAIHLRDLDAAPRTPAVLRERELTEKTSSRLQTELRARREELAQFEKFAQSQQVPDAWIR